jgi:hypothetical protein
MSQFKDAIAFLYAVIFLTLLEMKTSVKIILLIFGSCCANILFGQDNLDKEYVVKFNSNQARVSRQIDLTLDSIAMIMKKDTSWNYVFSGYFTCNPKTSNLTWNRINNVMARLVSRHKINPERLIYRTDESAGNCDYVYIRPTLEKIEVVAPPPLNLRKKTNE